MRKLYKKGFEMNSHILHMVLIGVLVFGLLLLAISIFSGVTEKQRQAYLTEFESQVQSIIDLLSQNPGGVEEETFYLPGVKTVCFVDLNKADIILENTTLVLDYPLVAQYMTEDDSKNMFLIHDNGDMTAQYGGEICFENYPFFTCLQTVEDSLDVRFENRDGCTTLAIDWEEFEENYIDYESKYGVDPLFITEEETSGNTVGNWREIVQGTTLATVKYQDSFEYFPYVIVYEGTDTVEDNLQSILDDYNKDFAYSIESNYPGGPYETESVSIPDDYLSFWEEINTVIVVDRDNERSAIVASFFANFLNAPLLFINDLNLHDYEELLRQKNIQIVTNARYPELGRETQRFIERYSSEYNLVDENLLRIDSTLNDFSRLQSTIELVD